MGAARIVIIHHLEHTKAAMGAAAQLEVAITLRSAPGAAATLGAAVFKAMIDNAARDYPCLAYGAILDCGGEVGFALNALRHGIKIIRIDAAQDVLGRIESIANKYGATIDLTEGPVLDLEYEPDARAACLNWLNSE